MNKLFKHLRFIFFLILTLVFVWSCSKKEDNPADVVVVKALDKTTIAPKKWYSQGSSFIHDLKANGVYATSGGTWKWKNDTDTMEIISQAGYQPTFWKVFWNTEHEMNCEKIGTFSPLLYKDSAW